MKVFLDIDGVLLGTDRTRASRAALADHAGDFLEFALRHCSVFWLSDLSRGGAAAALQHVVRHTPMSERERLMSLGSKVQATRFETHKVEALPQVDEPFVWLDDGPSGPELDWLRQRGWLDRWLWVDTREEPEDLLRAKRWLQQRLELAAGS
ncbi:MAG: hypothetical protein ACE37K_21105 [Planctomycetota bacterium]